MAQVVVVGAGVAGLAVAARLAKLRHDVIVLERSNTVGGSVRSFSRDGFTFDTGPTRLMLPAVYRDTFRKSGRPLERELDLVPLDPGVSYRFADGSRVDVPNASRPGAIDAIDATLGAGTGAQWDALMRRGEAVWQSLRNPLLESPVTGPGDLWPHLRNPHSLRMLAPWTSLRRLGRHFIKDPRLQLVLEHQASYVGSDPRRAAAALVLLPYVEQTFGSWYVVGGMHQLARALHERVLLRRVEVRTGCEVAGICVAGGKAVGVRLVDGEVLGADVIVSAVPADHLYRDLVHSPDADPVRRRLNRASSASSVFTMLLALRGRTPGLTQHTVLFPDDPDAELSAVFSRRAGPAAQPTITIAAPDDPALRPDNDSEAWVVQVAAPRHGRATEGEPGQVDWTESGLAGSHADRLLEVLALRGFDVRDRLLWREVRTPYDLQHETGAPGGTPYGIAWQGSRSIVLRPANQSPLKGLFLVGAGAHPGGGLPFVGLSAAIVANLIGKA